MISETLSGLSRERITGFLPCLLSPIASLAAVMSACLSLYLLITWSPFIQGVDFYYYTLISRDLAAGEIDVTPARYWYFPGFYSFWRMVLSVTPGDIPSLQWAFSGVLFLNALLIGFVAWELISVWQMAVIAGSIYPVQSFLLEGFYGTAEPVVTLPFLVGLWLWARLFNRGHDTSALTALGAGLGLAIFVKQQGILLGLGILGLVPATRLFKGTALGRIVSLIVVPITACAVFFGAMAVEGGGLSALKAGVGFAKSYPADWLLAENLSRMTTLTRPLTILFAASTALWMYCLAVARETSHATPLVVAGLGICIVSAVSGTFQFTTRGYLHYALLSLPSALIAVTISIGIVARMFQNQGSRKTSLFMTIVAGGILILTSSAFPQLARLFSDALATLPKQPPLISVAEHYRPICTHVPIRSALLLIPPRNNSVHWLCGTKSVAWKVKLDWTPPSKEDYFQALTSNAIPYVFMFSEDTGTYEDEFLRAIDSKGLRAALIQMGYREVLTIPDGILFQKP